MGWWASTSPTSAKAGGPFAIPRDVLQRPVRTCSWPYSRSLPSEDMKDLVESAAKLAQNLLDVPELGDRWRHVQATARRATDLQRAVLADDQELLIASAWLHDVGYASSLIRTGMHAIDGALFLQELGYPERLVSLVAHHTGARFEAAERGLMTDLDRFRREDGPADDALTTADLTTGPTGLPMNVDDRLGEILSRYPEDSAVHRAIRRARPTLEAEVTRTMQRWTSTASGARL